MKTNKKDSVCLILHAGPKTNYIYETLMVAKEGMGKQRKHKKKSCEDRRGNNAGVAPGLSLASSNTNSLFPL
jgi:hypothetical protein